MIRVWSVASKACFAVLPALGRVRSLSMCGSILASAGKGMVLQLWDVQLLQPLAQVLTKHKSTICAALLVRSTDGGRPGHGDDYVLATGGKDGRLEVATAP